MAAPRAHPPDEIDACSALDDDDAVVVTVATETTESPPKAPVRFFAEHNSVIHYLTLTPLGTVNDTSHTLTTGYTY